MRSIVRISSDGKKACRHRSIVFESAEGEWAKRPEQTQHPNRPGRARRPERPDPSCRDCPRHGEPCCGRGAQGRGRRRRPPFVATCFQWCARLTDGSVCGDFYRCGRGASRHRRRRRGAGAGAAARKEVEEGRPNAIADQRKAVLRFSRRCPRVSVRFAPTGSSNLVDLAPVASRTSASGASRKGGRGGGGAGAG